MNSLFQRDSRGWGRASDWKHEPNWIMAWKKLEEFGNYTAVISTADFLIIAKELHVKICINTVWTSTQFMLQVGEQELNFI